MELNPTLLKVQVKAQDRFRKAIANISNPNELTCVILGDSDINYENTIEPNNIRILDAPYNCEAIKYPLIYNGAGNGLTGFINCFARQIDSNGAIKSLYDYPNSNTLSYGKTIPTLQTGYDWNKLTFDSAKMGFILFFETVLDNYLDENNVPERMKEEYKMTITFNGSEVVPSNWEVIYDNENGSLLIGKNSGSISSNNNGIINILGLNSRFEKIVLFNI